MLSQVKLRQPFRLKIPLESECAGSTFSRQGREKAKCFSISLLVFDRVLCSLWWRCWAQRESSVCTCTTSFTASINRPNNCVEFQIHLTRYSLTSLHLQSASWWARSLATCTWPQVSLWCVFAVCVFCVGIVSGPTGRARLVSLSCACVAETLNNLNARINAARRLLSLSLSPPSSESTTESESQSESQSESESESKRNETES